MSDDVVGKLEQRVFRIALTLLTVAGPVLFGFTLVAPAGRASPLVWVQIAAFLVSAVALRLPLSWAPKAGLLVAMLSFTGIVGLVNYGPTSGVGLVVAMSALSAAFFLRRRGLAVAMTSLCAALVAVPLLVSLDVLRPPDYAPVPLAWGRMTLVTIFGLVGIAYMFSIIQRGLQAAVSAGIMARRSELAAQADREKALRATEASLRLEALGRLAAGVAHDVNNALVVIRVGVDLLTTASSEQERAELLSDIDQGVERATTTARQLLAFSRTGTSGVSTTDPAATLGDVARSVSRMIPAHISVVVTTQPTRAIEMAPTELEQMLLNLVVNACDAMPDGGRLELTCEEREGQVVIGVADTGVGMTPEVRARVFEPFFTTKGELGTGLGLAQVWGRVATHGGTVELDSAPGQGTRVWMRFPPAEVHERAPSAQQPAMVASAARRILLLEDQPDVRRLIERILLRREFVVDSAVTVAEALVRIAAADYDLFVTDGMLPDGTSAPAVLAFRARSPSRPILVCSGYLDPLTFKVDPSTLATLEYLPKPFSPSDLNAKVDAALARPG